jgi:hypothetical protein
LLRGRRPAIEIARPRIAVSASYLRDAHNKSLSLHTRIRCAYESLYFCCCEIASEQGIDLCHIVHPSEQVMQSALSAIGASERDRLEVGALVGWANAISTSFPGITVTETCKLAGRIHASTVRFLT